jgi:type I restriction enzyme, S subunit
MKPYPSYKDSEVDWIGEIPTEWIIKKGKYLFTTKKEINSEYQCDNLLSLTLFGVLNKDIESPEGLRPMDYKTYQVFYKDDLVFKLIDLENEKTSRVGLVHEKGIMSNVYIRLIPNIDSLPKYYFYQYYDLYKKYIFNFLGSGVRSSLTPSDLLNIILVFPSPSEQQQIVSFLDHKTQQIDELIEKTKKKIELLKEQRTSLINHCVTKGLNPNVEMKDSGIEWIGEIPRSWDISKLKYDTLIPVRYGLNISSDRYTEEGIRFIRITDLDDWGILNPNNGKYLIESDVDEEFLLSKYDLLLCRSGHTVGKSYLHLDDGKYTSGGYLVRFNFGDYYSSKFIFYITKTDFYWDWICQNTIISTIENVNGEKYSNMEYPKPPLSEQQNIVEYLDKHTEKIDSTIEKETQRIELLKEYRQSLISEVVTGKIDVREWKNDSQKLS